MQVDRAAVFILVTENKHIGLPAGLGAHAPVPAPSANDTGKKTLSGVAVTERPVYEHFESNPGMPGLAGDIINFSKRQFACQHDPGKSLFCCPFYPIC